MRRPRQTLTDAGALALVSPALPGERAHARGGFCNNRAPAAQSGENTRFGVERDGTLSTHIQIFHGGPSGSVRVDRTT